MLRVRHLGSLDGTGRPPLNPRERHLAQILTRLQRSGPSSRAVIADSCGLGISTMSELIGELRGRRLVTESEPVRTRTVGRPLREVSLDGHGYLVAGVDLEPTRLSARLDTLGGHPLSRSTAEWTPGRDDPVTLVATVLDDLVGRHAGAAASEALLAVEVAVPGVVRRATGEVVNSWPLGLRGRPLGEEVLGRLAEHGLPRTSVGIENDCNFSALAASVGIGCPAERNITIYIGGSVSVGGTVLIGDQLLRGGGGAGELGHYVLDPQGRRCWCGRQGCLSTVADLRLLVASTGLDPDEVEQLVVADPGAAIARVIAAAEAGEPRVDAALRAAADGVTAVLHGMHALLDPDLVLIGGFLGALGPQLERRLQLRRPTDTDGGSTAQTDPPTVRLIDEPDGSVVSGALISARTLCLRHPLHFGRSQAMPC